MVLAAARRLRASSWLWPLSHHFLPLRRDHGILLPASRPSHGGTRRGLPPLGVGVHFSHQLRQHIELRGSFTKGARCRGTDRFTDTRDTHHSCRPCLQGCVRPALSGVPLPLTAISQQWSGGHRHRIDRQHRAVPWSVSDPTIVPPLDRISAVELQLGRQTAGPVRRCRRRQEARSAHPQDGRYQTCDFGSAW